MTATGRISAALMTCIISLFLAACGEAAQDVQAGLIEVTLDSPEEVVEGGVFLDTPDQNWDGYGEALDVDGDVLVVGASEWNQCGHGSAYVYRLTDGTWREKARLIPSDRVEFEQRAARFEAQRFGSSVAVDGDTIAVGAPGNASPVAGGYTGAVYVYEYDGQAWMEEAKLTTERLEPEAGPTERSPANCTRMLPLFYGARVALQGDTLAVSGESAETIVYVYQRGQEGWREQARLPVPTLPGRDLHMASMDLFGDALVLSVLYAQIRSEEEILMRGMVTVYVFERTGDTWEESFTFTPEEGGVDLLFLPELNIGASVAFGGDSGRADLLAIGLPGFPDWTGELPPGLIGADEDPPEFPRSPRQAGGIYIFERAGEHGWRLSSTLRPVGWDDPQGPGTFPRMENLSPTQNPTQVTALFANFVFPGDLFSSDPETSFFGANVDLDGDRLAATSGFSNATYVFERQGSDWVYRFRMRPDPYGEGVWEDYAQVSVISEDTLILGTPGEFGNSAYVFDLPEDDEG